MQAVGELDLLSATVANHGVVSSTSGNVDVAVPSIYASAAAPFAGGTVPGSLSQIINIDNTAGSIHASNGTIDFGGTQPGQTALLSLTGGDLDAQAIDLQAGTGVIQADVNDVTGVLNVAGGSAHFASNSAVLDLGDLDVTGDPTYFNMGNIVINEDITASQSLAILATGDITATKAVLIQATNSLLGGQNVYIVAGAILTPSRTGSDKIPPGTTLMPGQSIQVMGASPTGGIISLANSTINTSPDPGSVNQPGGSVTLVAYGGSGTIGITGVNIISGGTGTGANGGVTLIAGDTLKLTTTAISGIAVNTTGGTGLPPAAIGMFAAQPQGAVAFDSNGIATGSFTPGTPTARDILLGPVPGGGITTDGGTITIKTGGMFSNQIVVSSSGAKPGRDAGDISIIAGSITLNAALLAVGASGAGGTNATGPGLSGGSGQNGGKGGMITLEGTHGITINAGIQADAGNGGDGGNGAISSGGAGGLGGNGGMAGTVSLTTTDAAISQAGGLTISADGGSGGSGGAGGSGSSAPRVALRSSERHGEATNGTRGY